MTKGQRMATMKGTIKKGGAAMEILYADKRIVVCIKPSGVVSTDEPGGMPELLRRELGTPCIRTVHRLDQTVGGLMVFARSVKAASLLSEQMRTHSFHKEYRAVLAGIPPEEEGICTDLLRRDPIRRVTEVVTEGGKGVQEAVLRYRVLESREGLSLVQVALETGRTHQIRVQFASRRLPLCGDRKYGTEADYPIALWSYRLQFLHPETGDTMEFSAPPPEIPPWTLFAKGQ